MPSPMSTTVVEPLFIPLSKFRLYGLPCRTNAYALDKRGLLNLTTPAGRTGVTIEEARRFLSSPRPIATKRDTTKGTIASLRARGKDKAADRLEQQLNAPVA